MTSAQSKRLLLILAPALVLMGLYTWVFHDVFTVHVSGAVDFYPRYAAAHLMLEEGINPYTPEATDRIQTDIFGAPLSNSEHHAFAYPLYTIFFTLPLFLLPDYAWVQAVWQVLLQVMLVLSVFLILRYFNWKPRTWMLLLLLLYGLFSYPSASAIAFGQFSTVVFFLTMLTFWLLFHGEPSSAQDIAAGVCLALSTIKPQMQFLIIPLLVLWGLRSKRWYFLGSAALSMTVLCGASFLILPTWFSGWIAQVMEYSGYTPPAIPHIIAYEVTSLGRVGMWLIYLLLGGYLLFEWWRWLRNNDPQRRDWTLALTLVITHMLAPRTVTTHYVVFLFVLFPLLRVWTERSPLISVGMLATLFAGYWWLFVITREEVEGGITYLVMPLVMLILLLPKLSQRAFSTDKLAIDSAAL